MVVLTCIGWAAKAEISVLKAKSLMMLSSMQTAEKSESCEICDLECFPFEGIDA